MASKTKYICSNCGYETVKYAGKCFECGEFGTMKEHILQNEKTASGAKKNIIKVEQIRKQGATLKDYVKEKDTIKKEEKLISNSPSFNTFFGGGLFKGSINLISGTAGVGKSTLLGYLPKFFPKNKFLYISGEETTSQILNRVTRMSENNNDYDNFIVYNENSLEEIIAIVEKENPEILVIDSLQTLKTTNSDGEEGGLKKQRYIAEELVSLLKEKEIPTFLVGHVTKTDEIAGSKFVEHLVDSVIKIEPAGERGDDLKIMKNLKNRFSGEDIMVYEMYENEIKIVSNAELFKLFIQETAQGFSGNALSAITLPNANQIFLIEIQSITSDAEEYPRNNINAYNRNSFENIIKIIGDNINENIYKKHVAVNIFSPLKNNDDEISLGIVMAIISHLRDIKLGNKIFIGKVGFRGEIKSINRQRSIIEKLKKYGTKESDIISNEKFKNIRDIVDLFYKNRKGK